MALSFLTSSEQTQEVVVTCDPEVTASAEQRSAYLERSHPLSVRMQRPEQGR
jgi:hypothetical protein